MLASAAVVKSSSSSSFLHLPLPPRLFLSLSLSVCVIPRKTLSIIICALCVHNINFVKRLVVAKKVRVPSSFSMSSPPPPPLDRAQAVKLSKLLSYVLRHGAAKEGLQIRPDGYVALSELVYGRTENIAV